MGDLEEKAKSVSFEDEEADRCPLGARERWLWAFRKINVSDLNLKCIQISPDLYLNPSHLRKRICV